MRIETEIKLDFKDVLIRPKRSTLKSRNEVDLTREFNFKHSPVRYKGIPVMAANMDSTGTFEMADALNGHKMFTCIHKHYSPDDYTAWLSAHSKMSDIYNNFAVSAGVNDLDKLSTILDGNSWIKYICLDVANGYTETFVQFVARCRARFPNHVIIAGNVVTGDMTEELILKGADIVKVGIGPGSVCTTRLQTGVGYPQLSAIIECADAAHGLGGHIVADGGCVTPGDISKAYGAGADFVMLGGMLSGHDESGGDLIEESGKKFKLFYGMSSDTAMSKYAGGVAEYRSSEGRTVKVPYKGPVDQTALDILGGIRSSCTYVGAKKLKELSKRTTFIRVNDTHNRVYEK